MSDEVEVLAIDTDGEDVWWIRGHHGDVAALAAVRESFGDEAVHYFPWPDHTVDYFTITRGWWIIDGERWERCRKDDEGAQAFTVLAL